MAIYVRVRTAQWLVEHLAPQTSFALARSMADAQWLRSRRDRIAVQHNLELVVGRPVREWSAMVRGVFRAFGQYLVEFLSMHRPHAVDVSIHGREHLSAAIAGGRGAILLTAHVGNWELGAAVALPHADPRTDALFNAQRERCGVEVIPLGLDSARTCLARLREGALVGLLGDQVFVRHGRPCRWFGRQVVLPTGPAVLSLRSGTAIIPTFAVREEDGAFRLSFHEPIWPEGTPGPRAVSRLLQRSATVLERVIRETPGQWLMFQGMTAVDDGPTEDAASAIDPSTRAPALAGGPSCLDVARHESRAESRDSLGMSPSTGRGVVPSEVEGRRTGASGLPGGLHNTAGVRLAQANARAAAAP